MPDRLALYPAGRHLVPEFLYAGQRVAGRVESRQLGVPVHGALERRPTEAELQHVFVGHHEEIMVAWLGAREKRSHALGFQNLQPFSIIFDRFRSFSNIFDHFR